MSIKQIAKGTNQSVQAVNRKINRMTPRYLEKKTKNVKVGKRVSKQKVRFYRLKKWN